MASAPEQARPAGLSPPANTVIQPAARLGIERLRTLPGIAPLDQVDWQLRDAVISGPDGPVFEQLGVEVPAGWSQTATNIVAQKYFRGRMGAPERERSVRQIVHRVAGTIAGWGRADGYFADAEEAQAFEAELEELLVSQRAAFNSPVWFNVGFEERPQCSACFILRVEDRMEDILEWIVEEGLIFRGGSGAGVNLSRIRSSREQLSKGGLASGPVSFMRGADASAGTIKSGGKTRRAAKMVLLDVDHPDIEEFIWCKAREEEKARALTDAGFDMSLDSVNWASLQYQNANNSVRLSDAFMRAVRDDADWHLTARTSGEVLQTLPARELLRQIAEAAWTCADPGVQYATTISAWHTSPASGEISASNPCSEFVFLDDTSCNLASINLLRYLDEDGAFDVAGFEHAVDLLITAQEILVANSSYPTDAIADATIRHRPLGLGYANLGALLMAQGQPYDSDAGRATAAAITALMTGRAYRQSARIAARMGAFDAHPQNAAAMHGVMELHRAAVGSILHRDGVQPALIDAARGAWDEAIALGAEHGYRNAQATCIAPTGTISFLMDCDTTGIEPDFALVKSKRLVGGGSLAIVNATVPRALRRLGYDAAAAEPIVAHIAETGAAAGAPGLAAEHLAVFDCAVGQRAIQPLGHVKMMAAVQPFLSGAISKTVNIPETATVEDVEAVIQAGWSLGLKALALYRDGSKVAQPLSSGRAKASAQQGSLLAGPMRRRMPIERQEIGRKFQVGEYEGYIHVGLFPDGTPGDVFIDIAKEGSTLAGLMNAFMISVSLGLQYGVPLEVYVAKFAHMRFEPAGLTNDPDIRIAKSIVDYVFRWLGKRFLPVDLQEQLGVLTPEIRARLAAADAASDAQPLPTPEERGQATAPAPAAQSTAGQRALFSPLLDAVVCPKCGAQAIRTGACYTCRECGENTGCG